MTATEGLDMDAIRARADAARRVAPDLGTLAGNIARSAADIPALLDHVRALEQENAGLREEAGLREKSLHVCRRVDAELDAARAALDGLRAAITVVIGPEGDEWRWSDSNLRERLRAVLGEHGGTS